MIWSRLDKLMPYVVLVAVYSDSYSRIVQIHVPMSLDSCPSACVRQLRLLYTACISP